jgi:hypothetical protein
MKISAFELRLTDFFGSVRNIELSNSTKLLIHESKDKEEHQNDILPSQRPLRSLDNFPSKPKVWDFYFCFRRNVKEHWGRLQARTYVLLVTKIIVLCLSCRLCQNILLSSFHHHSTACCCSCLVQWEYL